MADDKGLPPDGDHLEENPQESLQLVPDESEPKSEALELQAIDLGEEEPKGSESTPSLPGGDTVDTNQKTPSTGADLPPGGKDDQNDPETPDSASAKQPSNISETPSLIPSSLYHDQSESERKSNLDIPEVVHAHGVGLQAYFRRPSAVSSGLRTGVSLQRPAEQEVAYDSPVDVNRDPNHINSDLTLTFAEVFAEPDKSIHSIDCVWKTSNGVFSTIKLWTYRILTLFCAIPCACVWAVAFAILSVASIWIWSPWLKAFRIFMLCNKKVFDYVMIGFVMPVFEAIGRVFSFIRLSVNTHGEAALVYR